MGNLPPHPVAAPPPASYHHVSEGSSSIALPHTLDLQSGKPGPEDLGGSSVGPVIRFADQLPDELLVCIFNHVQEGKPYPIGPWFRSNDEWFSLMSDPIFLSHVCSSWRRVAIHSSPLWCRIYIHAGLYNDPRYLAVLKAYMTRSSQSLLDICILDSPRTAHYEPSTSRDVGDRFLEFLGPSLPRAKSVTLGSSRGLFSEGHPRSTLAACLGICVPGILKALLVEVATYDYPVSQQSDMSLGLPRSKLEELWSSILILRLNGYYPCAIAGSNLKSSQGLVELRLKGWHPIIESTLIGILVASPQLCILEVSVDILGSLSKGPSIEPIYLENLEVVKSVIGNRPLTHQRQLRILLRLLQPGPKPLSLCISNPNQYSGITFVCQPEVQAFLSRSNVRRLCVYDIERRSHLAELLGLVPSVQALAVPALSSLRPDITLLQTQVPLDSLYVLPSFLSLPPGSVPSPSSDWSTVEWLSEIYQVQKLTIWLQDFKFGRSVLGGSRKYTSPENLRTVCPIVNVMGREDPNPVQEWC